MPDIISNILSGFARQVKTLINGALSKVTICFWITALQI